uniref:nephrin n=1 Tax=Podarcis muralis TaxID=64176 RepID=UPI00109FE6B0|nr:nephrin [Podarcis muralis]
MVSWGLGILLIRLLLNLINQGCCAENLQQAFRVEPDNVTVHEGKTALLRCEVDNLSGIVQWVKDGLLLGPNQDIPRFPRYSMVRDPSQGKFNLQITRSQLEDDAVYECQVGPSEKSRGIISRSVLLSVLIPPKRPLIREYPANSTVTWVAGMEYTVHCQVEDARPAAEITFRSGDKEVTDVSSSIQPGSNDKLFSTEAMLRITPQSSDNRQRLTCAASNPVALIPVVVSFTMNILFPPQPPVIKGYDGPTVKAKDKLELTCISLSGNPLATLQWLKNDEVISTNWETDDAGQLSRSSLSLSITAEDNMATISCQALNQVLPLPLQASITLHVVFLPDQVKIIGSSSTEENKEVSLSCSTSASNPPVLLRWWLGWKELSATEVTVSEAAHGGMITVSNITYTARREDNGLSLICEAFNEAILYAKSATVTLRVQYPPQKIWIDVPTPETCFRAGTVVKLTCFASGGHPLPRLEWYKESKVVRDGTTPGSSGNIVSKELLLTTTASDNMAAYYCKAFGSSRTPALTAETRLHVQCALCPSCLWMQNHSELSVVLPSSEATWVPAELHHPALSAKITVTVKEIRPGQLVTLHCKSGSSNPPASLTWLKDGKRLKATNPEQKKAEFGGFSTSGNVTLVVSSADHGMRVECHAYSSVLSEGVNTFYQLTVLFPPEFSSEQPLVVQAVEHGAVQLPLLVSASPPDITYRWTFLGPKANQPTTALALLKSPVVVGLPTVSPADGGSLEIWNVTRADAGKYKIYCENPEGHNETALLLDVQCEYQVERHTMYSVT